MFVAADRFFQRLRAAGRGESGASLVLVIALMAMGFVVAMVIASAAFFAIDRNVSVKSSVQSFAAAEAGRDAVVAALEIAPESCPATAQYTADPDSHDPQFTVTLHPSALDGAPTSAAGILQDCPASTDKWVVLRSTGTAPDGSSTTIDAVYPWERFRIQVAGGGLGYMDSSLTSSWSNTSGDTVVKRGDFTCGGSTTFDGNVFVLGGDGTGGGNVVIRQGTLEYTTCTITGDLYASGTVNVQRGCFLFIFCGPATLRVGGQVKSVGAITAQGVLESGTNASAPFKNIESRGSIVTNHSDARIEALNGGAVKSEDGISSTSGPIRASGDIIANQSITAGAEIRSYGGNVMAGLDVTGGNTVRAQLSIVAGRNIDGGGLRDADGGSITAVGNIAGSGNREASGSVLAGGDISASGSVTAQGGDVHAGGAITGGTRTASRSVLARTSISSGAVAANGGDIRTNGGITGNADRIASGSVMAGGAITSNNEVRATAGSILAAGDITGSGARTAGQDIHAGGQLNAPATVTAGRDVVSVGNLTLTAQTSGACSITRDVTAGGIIDIRRRGSDTGNQTTTRCIVRGHVWSYSNGNSNAASTLPDHSTSGSSNRSQLWVTATSPDVRARGGWTPTNGRYRNTGGTAVDPSPDKSTPPGSAPVAPSLTAVIAPTVAAPPTFTLVLNEDPDGTWETFDDLQLRTTWVDLGTYTNWPGYTPIGPLTGARCGANWLGSGGSVRTILQSQGAVTVDGIAVPADVPVVIDATQCGTVNMGTWSATQLRRDAVLLVRNVSLTFAAFSASSPHQLAIVQVDEVNAPGQPAWNPGGADEPIPHCSSGQNRINMTFNNGAWDTDVHMLLYSPCGINGSFFASWRGHLYTHNDNVNADVLKTLVCEPMEVVGVVDLPCDINDIAEFGSMNTNAWRLGDRYSQTEP